MLIKVLVDFLGWRRWFSERSSAVPNAIRRMLRVLRLALTVRSAPVFGVGVAQNHKKVGAFFTFNKAGRGNKSVDVLARISAFGTNQVVSVSGFST